MLKLNQAQAIAAAAAAEAALLDTSVAIVVVDHHGAVVLAHRLDGAKRMSLSMAQTSAAAAVMATAETEYLVEPDCLTSVSGGLALHLSGCLAGGVGVSGAPPEVNERIARAARGGLASF